MLEPPIAPIDGDDLAWALRPLAGVAAEAGYRVVTEPMSQDIGGYCNPSERLIGLNDKSAVDQRAKTLVHELSHMLIHDDDAEENDASFSYAEEELIVEAVAFTVTASLGLDTSSFSIPYMASWSQQAPLETIERAAETIDRLARRIEDAVLPHRPEQPSS